MNTGLWGTLACAARHPPVVSARCSARGPGGDAAAAGVSPLKPQDRAAWSPVVGQGHSPPGGRPQALATGPSRSSRGQTAPQDTAPVNSGSPDSRLPSFVKIWRFRELDSNRQGTEAGASPGVMPRQRMGGRGGRGAPRTAPGGPNTSARGRAHSLGGRPSPRAPEGSRRG